MIRYYITDRKTTPDLLRNVERLAATRAFDWIQIREKDLSGRELFDLTVAVLALARPHGIKVLVNERADVALAAGADGIHLPSRAIAPTEFRRIGVKTIGVSCHNERDVMAASAQGADFAVLGPVFPPLSKQLIDGSSPLGLDEFGRIAGATSLPVLALGGMTIENAAQCMQAGAAGIAGISLFQSSVQ